MMVNETVKLIECPRDAWQGLKKQIPTELKVNYLRALIDSGFKHIDAASFVSPKAIPQMADSEQVLAQLQPPKDVEIIGIVVNEKGADRAIATNAVSTLGFPFSISETFLRKNQNQTSAENLEVLQAIQSLARQANLDVVVYISMAFGNPYADPWNENEPRNAVARLIDLGIRTISLADTVGVATPELVAKTLNTMIPGFAAEIGVHMHSTREAAVSKVLAAYDAGCRRFDSAMGGLGGCPFAQDALVGNIPTESVIAALRQRGVNPPVGRLDQPVSSLNDQIAADFS